MSVHQYISPQTGQKALSLPSTTRRRVAVAGVCLCVVRLCECMPVSFCTWNITASTGLAPLQCNWLSEGGKQDCNHVEGSWRLTFRKENESSGWVAALGTSELELVYDCCFDSRAVFLKIIFLWRQSWWGSHGMTAIIRFNLPYLHYSHGALCREDTFLEDEWVPGMVWVIHVSPSDKAGLSLVCGIRSVITAHLQRWKWDTLRELLKGVRGEVTVLFEVSAWDFYLPN